MIYDLRFTFLSVFLLLISEILWATGPSYLSSSIQPIATNSSGVVLCKTRLEINPEGAYVPIDVKFGYVVISKSGMKEFSYFTLNGNFEETYYDELSIRDSIFSSDFSLDIMNGVEKSLIKKYKLDSILNSPYNELKQIWLKDLTKEGGSNQQITLEGKISEKYYSQNVRILFENEFFYILENTIHFAESSYGATFSFINLWENGDGEMINIDFDSSNVDGVLYK